MTKNFWLCFLHAKSGHLVFYASLILFIQIMRYYLTFTQPTVYSFQLRQLQMLAESSLKIVYLPGLRNSVAKSLSNQPCEVGQPDEGDIGDYGSRLSALQDPIGFTALENWLQMVAPHLVLTGSMEAVKIALSSGFPVVSLDCKRYGRQYLDHRDNANWRHAIHFCASCGYKQDFTS